MPDSFVVLTSEFAPGTAVAVATDGDYEHQIVVNEVLWRKEQ